MTDINIKATLATEQLCLDLVSTQTLEAEVRGLRKLLRISEEALKLRSAQLQEEDRIKDIMDEQIAAERSQIAKFARSNDINGLQTYTLLRGWQ
jgi:hypothetical protein